jgi:hypothetical protein
MVAGLRHARRAPEKNFAKLLEYEYWLEELFRRNPALSGICQYHQDTLPTEVVSKALYVHPKIYIGETLWRLNPYYTTLTTPRPSC